MKACGVICEYNPFHYGHAYHLHKSREITGCDVMICAMSGNFVQRGEPAITDKWSRVKTAERSLFCKRRSNIFGTGTCFRYRIWQ